MLKINAIMLALWGTIWPFVVCVDLIMACHGTALALPTRFFRNCAVHPLMVQYRLEWYCIAYYGTTLLLMVLCDVLMVQHYL